jgi:3-hydroxyacyl-[acyl-carrier-protein] dehydratase
MNTQILPFTLDEILAHLPQKAPFRFIDQLLSVDAQNIVGTYTFKTDEYFYAGHFPGQPVTPGVILLECMCQIGVVALGIYLLSQTIARADVTQWLTFFSEAEVEFCKPVYPGTRVIVTAEKIFWRKMKLRAKIMMRDEAGTLLATATASGVGVKKSSNHEV